MRSFDNLKVHFKCFICHNSIIDARILLCCKQVACWECLEDWLGPSYCGRYSKECPHCRQGVEKHRLVEFPMFESLRKQIDEVLTEVQLCKKHHDPLLYYCLNCEKICCSESVVFLKEHEGHQFERLSALRKEFDGKLHCIREDISKFEKLFDKNVENEVNEFKSQYVSQVNAYVDMVEITLQNDFKRLTKLRTQDQKDGLDIYQQISHIFEEDLRHLFPDEAKKVKQANTWITEKYKDITAAFSVLQLTEIPDSISNEIEPAFVCFKFELTAKNPSVSISYLLNRFSVSLTDSQKVVLFLQTEIREPICVQVSMNNDLLRTFTIDRTNLKKLFEIGKATLDSKGRVRFQIHVRSLTFRHAVEGAFRMFKEAGLDIGSIKVDKRQDFDSQKIVIPKNITNETSNLGSYFTLKSPIEERTLIEE